MKIEIKNEDIFSSKYEQSLQSADRNRLNLQHRPYKSKYAFTFKDIKKSKEPPVLYKKNAANETLKQEKS